MSKQKTTPRTSLESVAIHPYQKRLGDIEKQEKNWDSYGANAASEESLSQSRRFAEALASGDATITPQNDGGIAFSWLNESVEIWFTPDGRSYLLFDDDEDG